MSQSDRINMFTAFCAHPQPVGVRALNLEEAIKIIQASERARQGRLRAKFMREIQRDEERQRRAKDRDLGAAAIDTAVVRIQKVLQGQQAWPIHISSNHLIS